MKTKRLLLALITLNILTMGAQDVIVKKDGTPILTKVLEVNTDNVKYKKHSNPKGPTYTIDISDILTLTYANGDKEDFGNTSTASAESNPPTVSDDTEAAQGFVQLPPDARNAEIIRQYSTIYQPTDKIKASNAQATRCFIFCGVKESSLMSNEELEMTIDAKNVTDAELYGALIRHYLIRLTNKTDKTIYIDKGNCFRVSSDGSSYTYYEPSEQTTVTVGGNSGASMNMGAVTGALGIGGIAGQIAGGLNVGGGSSHSTSTTYNQQRILAIPPHSFRYLTEDKFVQTQKGSLQNMNTPKYKTVEYSERFLFMPIPIEQLGIQKDALHEGEVCTFTETDLPWNRKYTITYSTSETFNTYSSLQCDVYIKEVIGSRSPKNQTLKYWRDKYGEDVMFYYYNSKKYPTGHHAFISSLDEYGIVGFTMFDGKEKSGTGTIIGFEK